MGLSKALGDFFGRERLAIAGVAAIELAMVSPLVATGVLGAGAVGVTIFRETQVQFAAQAGADFALAHGFNATKISNAAVTATTYTAINATPAPTQFCGCPSAAGVTAAGGAPPCTATCSGGFTAGTYVQANAQAQFSPIFPNPWQQPDPVTGMLKLTAQAIVRIK